MNTKNIINYKPKDFAELLGISVSTLQDWDRKGKLKANRTPTNRRYYTYDQYLEFKGLKLKIEAKSDLDLLKIFLKEIVVPSFNLGMSARKCADILIDNLNEIEKYKDYEVNLTQQKVAELAGVSVGSAARAINSMKKHAMLKKKGAKKVPGFKLMPGYFPDCQKAKEGNIDMLKTKQARQKEYPYDVSNGRTYRIYRKNI